MSINKLLSMYWNSFKNSKLLKKMVFSYIAVGFAVLFVFAVIIVFMISINSVKQAVSVNVNDLEKNVATSDYIFRNISSQYYKYYNDNIIRQALYSQIDTADDYLKIRNKMLEMESATSLVDTIYVISFEEDSVYSTITSVKKVGDFADKEAIELAKDTEDGIFFIPREKNFRLNNTEIHKGKVISLLIKENSGGALMVNISQPMIADMFERSYQGLSKAMIVTSKGLLVSGGEGEMIGTDMSDYPIVQKVYEQSDKVGSYSEMRHFAHIINYAKSDMNGLTYIVSLNRFSLVFENNNLFIAVIIGWIIFALISLIIASLVGWKNYIPISKLHKTAKKYYGSDTNISDSELTGIREALSNASRSVNNYFYVKKKEFVKNVLTGEKPAVIPEQFNDVMLDFSVNNFYVVQVRLDNLKKMYHDTTFNLPIIRYGLINISEELLSACSHCEGVEINGGCIAVLCCANDFDENRIKGILTNIQAQMNSIFDISVTCSVSAASDDPSEIPSLLKNASDAADYRFIYGKGSIIFASSMYNEQYREDDKKITQEIKNIASAIGKRDRKKLDERFDNFVSLMKNQEYHNVLQYLNLLVNKINTSMSEDFKTSSEINLSDIEFESETIGEAAEELKKYCGMYISSLDTESSAIPERIQSIISFIDENYTNSELNIDMIAQEVWLTPNYVRNVFKEYTGTTVFEYITQKRFDMACRLLSETKKPIKEIGTEVGFANVNYFYTAFKTRMGMTPSQYRNSNR